MVISINCMVGLSDELVGSFVEVVVPTTIGRTMHVHARTIEKVLRMLKEGTHTSV